MAGCSLRLSRWIVLCREPQVQTRQQGLSTRFNQPTPILFLLAFHQSIAFPRYPCVVLGTAVVTPSPPWTMLRVVVHPHVRLLVNFLDCQRYPSPVHCMYYSIEQLHAPVINDTVHCSLISSQQTHDRPSFQSTSFLPNTPPAELRRGSNFNAVILGPSTGDPRDAEMAGSAPL